MAAKKNAPEPDAEDVDRSMEAQLDPELEPYLEHDSPDVANPVGIDRFPTVNLEDPSRVQALKSLKPLDANKIQQDNARSAAIGGVAIALRQQEVRKRTPEIPVGDDPAFVYYIRCERADCSGPGIWIHTRPGGILNPNDWEANYKSRASDWPGHVVYCQCCRVNGVTTHLPFFHDRGKPVPNERHVGKIRRSEFEALLEKASA